MALPLQERPEWVKYIALEEAIKQKVSNSVTYLPGDRSIIGGVREPQVHKQFSWASSRQGHEAWNKVYFDYDFSLLEKRARGNGYSYSDTPYADFVLSGGRGGASTGLPVRKGYDYAPSGSKPLFSSSHEFKSLSTTVHKHKPLSELFSK